MKTILCARLLIDKFGKFSQNEVFLRMSLNFHVRHDEANWCERIFRTEIHEKLRRLS